MHRLFLIYEDGKSKKEGPILFGAARFGADSFWRRPIWRRFYLAPLDLALLDLALLDWAPPDLAPTLFGAVFYLASPDLATLFRPVFCRYLYNYIFIITYKKIV